MRAELTKFSTGWIGIRISLSPAEIEQLITRLGTIRDNPDRHFHLRSNWEGSPGVGDIEFSVKGAQEADNMALE